MNKIKNEIKILMSYTLDDIREYMKKNNIENNYEGEASIKSLEIFKILIRSKGEMIIKMKGNKNSCYRNGVFTIKINFSPDYPNSPPLVEFETPIYHVQYNNESIWARFLQDWKSDIC